MKYVPLCSVIPHIPQVVRERYDESTLMFHAFNAMRLVNKLGLLYDYKIAVCEVSNHTAGLPDIFLSLSEGVYTYEFPDDQYTGTSQAERVYTIMEDKKVLIGQAFYYSSIIESLNSKDYCPLKLTSLGQDVIANDCIDTFCDHECEVKGYIDYEGRFIRIEEESGYVTLLFKSYITNDDGDILIPDDIHLIQAIAYYVSSKVLEEQVLRREPIAELYVKFSDSSNRYFAMFNRKMKFMKFRPENLENVQVTRLFGPSIVYKRLRR